MIKRLIMLSSLTLSAPSAGQTQMQMYKQATAQLRVADASMTRRWKAIYQQMNHLDSQNTSRGGGFGYAPTALESQRAWLPFRDRQCEIEAGRYAGGSMAPMIRTQCLTRLTRERTEQLGKLIWNAAGR